MRNVLRVEYSIGTSRILAPHSMRTADTGPDYNANWSHGQEENSKQKKKIIHMQFYLGVKHGKDFEKAG